MRRWTRALLSAAKRARWRRAREQRLAIGRTRPRASRAIEAFGPLLGRANLAVGEIKPPLPDSEAGDTPTKSVRSSVLSTTLCLGMAALLVSGKIVEIADRLPLGPDRERWLEVAAETDRLANRLSLNRPYDLLRDLRGAGDEAGQQIDFIGDIEELRQLELDGISERPDGEAAAPADEPVPAPGEPPEASPREPSESDTLPGEPSGPDNSPREPDNSPNEPRDSPNGPDDSPNEPRDSPNEPRDSPSGPDDSPNGPDETDALPGEPVVTPAATTTTAAIAATTTTTKTAPEEPPAYVRAVPVSTEAPLAIWVAGDSQAFHIGYGMRREGRLKDVMEVTVDQRHSTGLTRPGYFNWPVHLFAIAANYNPEVVVATLGSNDWQSMTGPEGQILGRGSDEWRAEWHRRLGVAFDVLEAPHRHVIWVGLPPTRSDEFREGYAVMNQLAATAVAERDFVTMIDIWEMFGGDEPYREAVPPPGDPEGRLVDVRQRDGVHLNQAGASWVIDLITDEIDRIIARISPETVVPAGSGAQPESG